MTKFLIKNENIKRLNTMYGLSKEISTITTPIFIIANNKLNVYLASSANAMNYSVDIDSYTKGQSVTGEDYFSVSLGEMCSTLLRIAPNSDVEVTVDRSNNKVSFVNTENKTKVSIKMEVCDLTESEVIESRDFISKEKVNTFTNNIVTVNVTPDLCKSFDAANKFISRTTEVNAILVNGSTAKYADITAIIEKKLDSEVSSEDVYIQKSIIDFVKPLIKTGTVSVIFNSEKNKVYVESAEYGFSTIMTLPEVKFMLPSEEEYNAIIPEDSECVKVKVAKSELKNAFDIFAGTFKPENWRVGQITVNSSKDNLNNNKIHLEHSDYTAECFLDLPVEVISNTENKDDSKFILGSTVVNNILECAGDEVTITYNSLEATEEHGVGFTIESENLKAVSLKYSEA